MNDDHDRDLLARTGRLPRSIEPPEDLWPGIASRISQPTVASGAFGTGRSRPWWSRASVLAAAALVLVTLSSAITVIVLRLVPVRPVPFAVAPDQAGEFRILEAEYARAADDLVGLLQRDERKISPATRAILERNLAVIDAAINESRAALRRDPGNSQLEGMILANYHLKLDLLRRVAAIT